MLWLKIAVIIMPLPALYLVYARYFVNKPEFRKHAEAFAGGVFLALLLYVLAPVIQTLIPTDSLYVKAFIKAALIEKSGAFILLLIILRYYPGFSVVESIIASAIFGVGFAAVENAAYISQFGNSIAMVRSLFSLPLHLSTCGILGYYLGTRAIAGTGYTRMSLLLKGIFLTAAIHGTYDYFLISNSSLSYAAAPLLVLSVALLEFVLARSRSIPSRITLSAMNLRYEDWRALDEQSRYERWILKSMGRSLNRREHLFIWEPGIIRLLVICAFMASAVWGLSFREEIISALNIPITARDAILILGVFPVSISVILMVFGSANPEFFAKNEMRIPVISDAEIETDGVQSDTAVTYSISHSSCFIKTCEPIGIGKCINVCFSYGKYSSGTVKCESIWENHSDRQNPTGTLLKIVKPTAEYRHYISGYRLFKLRKGIIFNLRLPGFESSHKLFAHPLTAMQEDRLYRKGESVFSEGDDARHFYLLKKGRVHIIRNQHGTEMILGTIAPGQLFGEMAVIPGRKRGSSAICDEDSIIAVSERDNLADLIHYNPDFAFSMIQMLAERTEASESILLEHIALLERKNKI
jgi:RsiW-degrading membrane proteinase PrsW (M82 family)